MSTKQITNEYLSRINKVLDYIENHIDNAFTLDELAFVSNFSKFHFHRIFIAITGETPFQFIQRVKLEKAAANIINSPELSITEISQKCGFSDISIFSRNFKNHFKISASEYRLQKSNLSQIQSNKIQLHDDPRLYFCSESQTIKWKTKMELNKSIEVKELQDMTVAYIRHIGPYKGDEKLFEGLWNKLYSWAGPRGLIGGENFTSLCMYHDDPNITNKDKLRLSVCISVPPETKVEGEVGKMKIEGGKYVVARFELNAKQFSEAWEWVYGQWFPNSGYQPADKPSFEIYPCEPKEGIFVVDICVPVKPL